MTPRTHLMTDVRGAAIYVEFLIVVPIIALLMMTARYMHQLGTSRIETQREARSCAWAFAGNGCQGSAPAGCELEGPSRLADPQLDRVVGSGLESVVRPVRGLGALFRRPTGDEVVARTTDTVEAPAIVGAGDTRTGGMHRMMCNDRPRELTDKQVMDITCPGLLGPGGECQ